jgi:hypothetical protein
MDFLKQITSFNKAYKINKKSGKMDFKTPKCQKIQKPKKANSMKIKSQSWKV